MQANLHELVTDKLPKFMQRMDKRLAGGDKRYLINHEISIADFALGSFFL